MPQNIEKTVAILESHIERNNSLIMQEINSIKHQLSDIQSAVSKIGIDTIRVMVNEELKKQDKSNKSVFAAKWVEKFNIGLISVTGTAILLAIIALITT